MSEPAVILYLSAWLKLRGFSSGPLHRMAVTS